MTQDASFQENLPIGIVAGNGSLPAMVLKGVHAAGRRLIVAGLRGEVQPSVLDKADACRVFALGSLDGMIQYLKKRAALKSCLSVA